MTSTRTRAAATAALLALVLTGCAPESVWEDPQPQPPPGGGELILDPETVPDPAYVPMLEQAAATCDGIDAPTLAAQIESESNWNPDAQSPAGAQGISQFMPATWAAYGIDGNSDGVADVWDPGDAIPSQGLFMCAVQEAIVVYEQDGTLPAGQRLEFTLAGYNAGPAAVGAAGGIPQNGETEFYVPKIMGLRQDYAMHGGGTEPIDGYDPAPIDCPGQGDPMEYNLQDTTVRGLRCVRGAFPYITITSGWRPRGSTPLSDHPAGLALDQASHDNAWDTPEGRRQNWRVAHWFQVNADRLAVKYVIFHNYRWPAYDGRDAWVPYDHDSGSGPSLDHHDHVHISFNSTPGNPEAPLRNHAPREGTHPRGIWIDPADALP